MLARTAEKALSALLREYMHVLGSGCHQEAELKGRVAGFRDALKLAHPVGSQLTIYYSKKNPQFHKVNTPPSKLDLIRASLARIMITMGLFNIPSAYFYWLIGAAAQRRQAYNCCYALLTK